MSSLEGKVMWFLVNGGIELHARLHDDSPLSADDLEKLARNILFEKILPDDVNLYGHLQTGGNELHMTVNGRPLTIFSENFDFLGEISFYSD